MQISFEAVPEVTFEDGKQAMIVTIATDDESFPIFARIQSWEEIDPYLDNIPQHSLLKALVDSGKRLKVTIEGVD